MSNFNSTISPTPFGFFDSDSVFQTEADNMVMFVKRKLGDDVLSVELTKKEIWACFEEACCEYSRLILETKITSRTPEATVIVSNTHHTLYFRISVGVYVYSQIHQYMAAVQFACSYCIALLYTLVQVVAIKQSAGLACERYFTLLRLGTAAE